ncbi:hypothetical protein Tco_0444877 [Tanacetum coccineum]
MGESSIPIGGSISPEGFLLLVLLVVVERMNSRTGIIRVPVGPVFLLGLLALAIVAACALRAEKMPSLISCWDGAKVMAGVSDVDVLLGAFYQIRQLIVRMISQVLKRCYGMIHNDGDGDNDAYDDDWDDDERDIRTKKYRGSNSSDGGNTRDGVKIASGVIGSGDEIGEITDGIILEFSEELKEMLPDEAGK